MKYVGAEPVSQLAMAVKPRYHFAGKHHRFYERTPYRLGMCVMNTSPCASWMCVSLVSQEPSSVTGRTATRDQVHISCSSWKS